MTLTYFVDYTLWGLKPFGYHLTNVLIHSANVVLVYLFALVLFTDRKIAFLAALLFAVHPVQSEAVNAISFREDLLVVLFLLPSFLLYLKVIGHQSFVISHRREWLYFISLLLYMLALFSKEMAVTFPLLLILYHICFRDKGQKTNENTLNQNNQHQVSTDLQPKTNNQQLIFYLAGYIVVTLLYLYLYFGPLSNPDPVTFPYPDIWIRLLNIPKVLAQYFWLILVPWELNAHYMIKFSRSLTEPSVFIFILILAGFVLVFFRFSMKYRKELFGLLWFFIALLPVVNIIPINNPASERYLYLPFIGISIFISIWLTYFLDRDRDRDSRGMCFSYSSRKEKEFVTVVAFLLLVYASRTVLRNMDWKDGFSLWSKTVVSSPHSSRAHYNLGNSYLNQEQWQMAIKEYQATLRLKPDHYKAHGNLGVAYKNIGRQKDAIQEYKKSLIINPDYAAAHYSLGIAFAGLKQWQEAIKEFQTAIYLNPNVSDAHYNLGIAYTGLERWQEVIKEYRKALRLEPDNFDAHNNLGVAYANLGQWQEAIKEWNTTLSLDPKNEVAKKNLERMREKMGKNR